MTPARAESLEERDELTAEEAEQFAEEQARKYLRMSIAEFRQRAHDGNLPEDDPVVVHIALLAGVELQHC